MSSYRWMQFLAGFVVTVATLMAGSGEFATAQDIGDVFNTSESSTMLLGALAYRTEATTADAWNVELVGHSDVGGFDVGVVDNYVYITDFSNGLYILDVSDPTHPQLVGFYDTGGAIRVDVVGNLAYVVDFDGLRIINVANPASPVEVGYYDAPSDPWDVAVSGNYAYLAEASLRIIDVSNPAVPTEVGFYGPGEDYYDVVVAGNFVYAVGGGYEFDIINVADPTAPVLAGTFRQRVNYSNSIALAGNYAYVANDQSLAPEGGLSIINVTDKSNPTEAGYYEMPGYAGGVDVSGNYAYVTDLYYGLRVIDVSHTADPTEVGRYDISGTSWSVALGGEYAYVVNEDNGLWILRFTGAAPKYSINGRVLDQTGAAIAGVQVCTQSANCVTTNASGNYSLGNLAAGSYTLTATRSGYTFTPASRVVVVPPNATGVNFTGTASTYSISGRVQNQAGAAMAGVNVCAQNGLCATTNSAGNYSFSNLPAGSYTLTATKSGYTFTPASRAVTVPPNATGVNFTGAASTYSISGRVQNQAGAAIASVNVCVAPGICATTDDFGDYRLDNLPPASYTVTPTKPGTSFSPEQLPVTLPPNATGVNFTGVSTLDLGFLLHRDGFRFANYQKCGVISVEDWRYMFGDLYVCTPPVIGGLCSENRISLLARTALNGRLCRLPGRCDSMAATSLMLFQGWGPHEHRDEPSDFNGAPNISSILFNDIQSYLDANIWRQALAPVSDYKGPDTPSGVLAAIRNGIIQDEPVIVSVSAGPGQNAHVLVPIRVEDRGNGLYWVRVYDSNRPYSATPTYGEYPLIIDTVAETWSFPVTKAEMWSGDADSHTLSSRPVSLYAAERLPCFWCVFFKDRAGQIALDTVIFTGPGHLLIEGSQGRIGFVNGQFVDEMEDGSANFLVGGLGYDDEPVYRVPIVVNDEEEGDTYWISVLPDGRREATDARTSVALFGRGQGLVVDNIVSNGANDLGLWIGDTAEGLLHILANRPQELTIKLAVETDEGSTLYQVGNFDMAAPRIMGVNLRDDRSTLVVGGYESSAGMYDLFIDDVAAAGEAHFRHWGVSIGGGDTHYIDVSRWQTDGYVTVAADTGGSPDIDEEFILVTQDSLYLPIVSRR